MIKNTMELKQHNKYTVLSEIIERQPVSRKELSQVLDVSSATISSIIKELIGEGMVIETRYQESTGGRPPRLVEFRGDLKYVIAIELSYTYISYAIYDLNFSLKKEESREVGLEKADSIVAELYHQIIDGFFLEKGIKLTNIIGIGISVPGIYNYKDDILTSSISDIWKNVHIKKEFNKYFDISLYIENDANISAYYESAYGVGMDYSNLLYIFIAEGIGSGLVINNRLYRGAHGVAGEISHLRSSDRDIPCECGNSGCLEVTSSMSSIKSEVITLLEENSDIDSILQDMEVKSISIKDIIIAYKKGDRFCTEIINRSVNYFINTLSGLVNFLDPDLIILGDIYDLYNRKMIKKINKKIGELSISQKGEAPEVVRKSEGDFLQLLATAKYVFDKWKYTV